MRTIHKELLRARMEMIYLYNQSRNNSNLGTIDQRGFMFMDVMLGMMELSSCECKLMYGLINLCEENGGMVTRENRNGIAANWKRESWSKCSEFGKMTWM